MSAKIVPIRGKPKPITPPARLGNLPDIDADFTVMVRAFINKLVRDYVMGGGRINSLALRAHVSTQTVSRLAYYETTRPQWHTVMAVIMALGALPEFALLVRRYADAAERGAR